MNVSTIVSHSTSDFAADQLLSETSSEDAKPLDNAEWGRFALWLKEKSTTPAELLVTDPKSLLHGWYDARISVDRIVQLLNRGHSLAIAMEKWQRAGSGCELP